MDLKTSEICKVLSVETRLKIIKLLKTKGPMGAKNIAESLGVTPAAISQHLKILSQVGLVNSERKGFCIPYTVNDTVLNQCRQLLSEACLCGCEETGLLRNQEWRAKERASASLETLRRYENDLHEELNAIREKINELESQKK